MRGRIYAIHFHISSYAEGRFWGFENLPKIEKSDLNFVILASAMQSSFSTLIQVAETQTMEAVPEDSKPLQNNWKTSIMT